MEMKTYKLLVGLTVSSFLVFLVAYVCSELLRTDTSWYNDLDKPFFCLRAGGMSAVWLAAYLGNILCFGRLISQKLVFPEWCYGAAVWVCAVVFMLVFFVGQNLAAGWVVLLFMLAAVCLAQARFLFADVRAGIAYVVMTATVIYHFLLVSAMLFSG